MLLLIYVLLFAASFFLCLELIPEIRRKEKGKGLISWLISKVASFNRRLKIDSFRKSTQEKLSYAGYSINADSFLAVKELVSLFLFLLLIAGTGKIDTMAILLSITGFFLPDIWLKEKIAQKRKKIIRELPYFMDILALCVEAGLDFGAAINRILQKSRPSVLKEEINLMLKEIRVGRSREEALHNLARRLNIPEVSAFCSSLIQSDRMGMSLGQTLRVQSEQIRTSNFLRAEKSAHEAPVKLLFPLIVFIFPVIFIVLLGPVLLQMLGI